MSVLKELINANNSLSQGKSTKVTSRAKVRASLPQPSIASGKAYGVSVCKLLNTALKNYLCSPIETSREGAYGANPVGFDDETFHNTDTYILTLECLVCVDLHDTSVVHDLIGDALKKNARTIESLAKKHLDAKVPEYIGFDTFDSGEFTHTKDGEAEKMFIFVNVAELYE